MRRALALGLVGALVAAVPASAAWTDPEALSPDGSNVRAVVVGMDQTANTVGVWLRTTGPGVVQVQTSTRSASGAVSRVQTVSSNSNPSSNLRVAVAPDGSAVVVWSRVISGVERVQARQLSAAGVLGPTLTLSSSAKAGNNPDVAIDSSGNAVVAWQWVGSGTDFRIQGRALSAGGVLSATQNLSAAGEIALFPSVAMAPDGRAVIAWTRREGFSLRAQIVARSAAGALSPVQTLSPSGADATDPRVAISPSGDAVVTWVRFDNDNNRLQARARSAAGVLAATQTLSPPGGNAQGGRLTMGPDGAATFAWQFGDAGVQVRGRASNGTLSPVQTLDAAGTSPALDADADGDVIVGWLAFDGQSSRAWAKERFAGGTFGSSRVVSPIGMNAFGPIDVERAPDGRTALAWVAAEGAPFARADVSVGP